MWKILLLLLILYSCKEDSLQPEGKEDSFVLDTPKIKAKLIDGGDSILVHWLSVENAVSYVCQVDEKEFVLNHTQIKLDKSSQKVSISAKGEGQYVDSKWSTLNFNFKDIDVLKSRICDFYYKAAKASDADIANILQSINENGSFPGIDYANDTFNGSGEKYPHLRNMQILSYGYVAESSQYYKNDKVYASLVRATEFWLDGNFKDKNWWHRTIGFPNSLIHTFVLLSDELAVKSPDLYYRLLSYLSYSWIERPSEEGANATDICKFSLATAVMDNDLEFLDLILKRIGRELAFKNEGIQPDYSFSQHIGYGKQLYLGTYGREFIVGMLYFLEVLNGTEYQFPVSKIDIFDGLFLNGVTWMWYKETIDDNQCGRALFRSSIRNGGTAREFISFTKRLIALNTSAKAEHLESLKMMEGGQLLGNKMYPFHDYMIHRGDGFMVTSRMTSKRTVGNEAGNGEGKLNYHTGDGVNYIKVTGKEYEKLSEKWSWKHLPGITVVADSYLPSPEWGKGGTGGSTFASGASNGKIGVCGFIYNKDKTTAYKSWFYFKDYFVALGAGISSTKSTGPVVTTINQTLDVGSAKINVATTNGYYWNNDVGYIIVEPISSSQAIANEVKKVDDYSLFKLTINHGKAPKSEKYAYAVYPNVSKDVFKMKKQNFEILSNTSKSQAVLDIASGEVSAVFYGSDTILLRNNLKMSADKGCFVIYEGGKLIITSTDGSSTTTAKVNVFKREEETEKPDIPNP